MANTVVGLFRSEEDVRMVMDELTNRGFTRGEISRHDEGDASLRSWLTDMGVPDQEAEDYVLGVRNGGKLVTLEASDDRAPEAVDIMQRHERGSMTSGAGMAGTTATGRTGTTTGAATGTKGTKDRDRARTGTGDEERVEVVEEDVEVGTRQVERGGAQVRTYVSERPVEKEVRVRDESVHVDRRPADRSVSDAEAADAFQEKTVRMTETDEEPVVRKRARVVEEVVLHKDVDERTETVRDTARRTDVEVEGADTDANERRATFDRDREHYRTHHRDTFASSEYGYDEFEPAYRYGIDLANHPDYRDRDWSTVSAGAREHWERRNPGTWSDFEPAVRYGYERGGSGAGGATKGSRR